MHTLDAGIRYFGRGALLGCEPTHLNVTDAFEAPSATTAHVSFCNGFWNHTPFMMSPVTVNSKNV